MSGIAVISGWHCTATRIEIEIDGGGRVLAGAGIDRLDTATVCGGRRNTGYSFLANWGVFNAGPHTLVAFADGVEFARANVTVVSLGAEFLTGKSAAVTVNDFPSIGRSTVLEWRESAQSFVVKEVRNDAPSLAGRWNGANLEVRSGCTAVQNNGNHGTYAQYLITLDGGTIGIDEATVTGLTCTYMGPYQQNGTTRTASGFYRCNDGKQGNFTATSFLVTPNEMSIRLAIQLTGAETCAIDSILGGSRLF
ncbi:hypothetical protein BWI17_21130 [Betaproteobacteria bacterium GR16-43]|nr:hypothetical protein BWI17_21130 [Betaproteobacteria bacterium GR16-43]